MNTTPELGKFLGKGPVEPKNSHYCSDHRSQAAPSKYQRKKRDPSRKVRQGKKKDLSVNYSRVDLRDIGRSSCEKHEIMEKFGCKYIPGEEEPERISMDGTYKPHLERIVFIAENELDWGEEGFEGSYYQFVRICGLDGIPVIESYLKLLSEKGAAAGTKRLCVSTWLAFMRHVKMFGKKAFTKDHEFDMGLAKERLGNFYWELKKQENRRADHNDKNNRIHHKRWVDHHELEGCGIKAKEVVFAMGDRFREREEAENDGKTVRVQGRPKLEEILNSVDALMMVLFVFAKSGRPGALSGVTLKDLNECLDKPDVEDRLLKHDDHKTGGKRDAVIDFRDADVHRCARIYVTYLRPAIVAFDGGEENTDLAFINSLNSPLHVSRSQQRFLRKHFPELRLTNNNVRVVQATKINDDFAEGKIDEKERDALHFQMQHTPGIANRVYDVDGNIRNFKKASAVDVRRKAAEQKRKRASMSTEEREEAERQDAEIEKRSAKFAEMFETKSTGSSSFSKSTLSPKTSYDELPRDITSRPKYTAEENALIIEHFQKVGTRENPKWGALVAVANDSRNREIFHPRHRSRDSLTGAARRLGLLL